MTHCYTKHVECPDISCSECTIGDLKSICCICGCEVNLREVCLVEDTGQPICNNCADFIPEDEEFYTQDQLSTMWHGMGRSE